MFHVLLVEDNPSDVLLIREAIRTSTVPADVMVAYDGAQAMRLLREFQFKPDVIILDISLPKLGGLEVLGLYDATTDGRSPVVVFTGSNNPDERQRALALGAREHIVKPNGLEEFMGAVRGAIERWTGSNTRSASAPNTTR